MSKSGQLRFIYCITDLGGQLALIGFIMLLVILMTTFCQRRSKANKEMDIDYESRQKRHKKFINDNLQEEQVSKINPETLKVKQKAPKVPDRRKKKPISITNV